MNDQPPPARPRRSGFRWLLTVALLLSLSINFVLLGLVPGCGSSVGSSSLEERHYAGKATAHDKIAVVRLEGVIMEGMLGYVHKQIDKAAADPAVKAIVLRINSPGGTITASDDLHRRITELREGSPVKHHPGKPLVVSMASLAASGGYYVAMPAQALYAERTTITGSIGVYAAFPNVAELADKHGVRLNVIKAGRVKDSGSMFHTMTPQERQIWQDMIDHTYRQFLQVVETGRPKLKGLLEKEVLPKTVPVPETGEHLQITRQRADGGIFTSDQALELGLIDKIGYLEDAIREAHDRAGLGDDYRVITYEKPVTLLRALFDIDVKTAAPRLELRQLANGAIPRLWYLAPQCELAGILAASAAEEN
jgi:protease IV